MRYIPILLIFLASCTPQQKLNRLIGKHPELAQTQFRDTVLTVYEIDTVVIPERSIDTFFLASVDTFIVRDSGVSVTVVRDSLRWKIKTIFDKQTLYIRDTVKIRYTDTVNVFKVEPVKIADIWKWRKQGALWWTLLWVFIVIVIVAVRIYLKSQIPFLK